MLQKTFLKARLCRINATKPSLTSGRNLGSLFGTSLRGFRIVNKNNLGNKATSCVQSNSWMRGGTLKAFGTTQNAESASVKTAASLHSKYAVGDDYQDTLDSESAAEADLENMNKSPKETLNIINYKKKNEDECSNIRIGQNNEITEYNPMKKNFAFSKKEIERNFAYYFLPNDYPHSVASGYAKFTILFTISSFSITVLSFISTQALFVALGSTTTKASLYSAAYTWVLKDGIGQLGAILFAGKYGKSFDEDVKKWRFLCMVTMNIAIIIEMITLRFPGAFIYLASIANVGKNVTFLCAAATRANINLRFAKRNNIGDIAGKAVTQFTTASLLGIGVGLVISKAFNIASMSTIFPLFTTLTAVNVACSYFATKVVDEYYFNKQRFHILYEEFVKNGKILDVKEVNEREVFYLPAFLNKNRELFTTFGDYSLTEQINYLKDKGRHETADSLISLAQSNKKGFTYYVHWPKYRRTFMPRKWSQRREYFINFNMHKDATNEQVVDAYFFGLKLDEVLDQKLDAKLTVEARRSNRKYTEEQRKVRGECLKEAIEETEQYFEAFDYEAFHKELKSKGWRLDTVFIDKGTNRYAIE